MTLEEFFAAQARFYAAAGDPPAAARALIAEFPGWGARPARLELYAGFVHWHVRSLLQKLYPETRAALEPATWDRLVDAYYDTRPTRVSYDPNPAGEAFPSFLEERLAGLALPGWLPALARFEWTRFRVYTGTTELPARVERLAPNPTLEVLEHGWALCAYLNASPPRSEPARGDELALLWRKPETLVVHWIAATPRTLLAIKVAAEGLDPADVAREGGVAVEDVQAALDEGVRLGVVLAAEAQSSG